MHAIVLVGGQGTRLRPLTYSIPKPMLPIVETPMIGRVIEWLADFAVDTVVFSLGYRPDAFVEAFPDGEHAGVKLIYAVEPEPLDTAGAIRFAAERADLLSESVIVVNGDVLTDLDLDELVAFHKAHGGSATIALTPVDDPSAYGVVPTDARGCVEAFIEKPVRELAPTNMINAGTYVLEKDALSMIPEARTVSIEREIFPALVGDSRLFAMASGAYWIDTGTPERYIAAQFDVLAKRRSRAALPESREVAPNLYLAPGAICDASSSGSVFVGKDARAEKGARLHDAVLGARARVGPGATVRSSVLLAGASIGAGALVECSIVGPGATIGERAIIESCIVGADFTVARDSAHRDDRLPL